MRLAHGSSVNSKGTSGTASRKIFGLPAAFDTRGHGNFTHADAASLGIVPCVKGTTDLHPAAAKWIAI